MFREAERSPGTMDPGDRMGRLYPRGWPLDGFGVSGRPRPTPATRRLARLATANRPTASTPSKHSSYLRFRARRPSCYRRQRSATCQSPGATACWLASGSSQIASKCVFDAKATPNPLQVPTCCRVTATWRRLGGPMDVSDIPKRYRFQCHRAKTGRSRAAPFGLAAWCASAGNSAKGTPACSPGVLRLLSPRGG